jgi:hypothetical protein
LNPSGQASQHIASEKHTKTSVSITGACAQNQRPQVSDSARPDPVAEGADGDCAHACPRIHGHGEHVRGRGLAAELRCGEHVHLAAAAVQLRTSLMIVGVSRMHARSGPSKPAHLASTQKHKCPCPRARRTPVDPARLASQPTSAPRRTRTLSRDTSSNPEALPTPRSRRLASWL